MSGDYSRDSFDALRDYAGVFLQQGRAVLDSDWNELVRIFERRIRSGTVDTIGRAVVPRETPRGFEVRPAGGSLELGEGNFYLHGVLYQNRGRSDFFGDRPARPAPVFDRARIGDDGPEGVLDEMIAPKEGDFLPYEEQPYWPTPAALPGAGTHLVYLVGWQREVSPTEAPGLLEPALGGLDTTTRWQSVWQVRVLPGVGEGAVCATPDAELTGWLATSAPSTARLSTGTVEVEEPENPCLVPPTEGYTGIENQLYCVEIHGLINSETAGNPPEQGDWGFKFSRENASVRAVVEAIAEDAMSVTVGRIGRDEVLAIAPGDWVEVTDDVREFDHRSGQMLRVAEINPDTREVLLEAAIAGDLVPSGDPGDTLASRHTRIIRWDQRGIVRLADEDNTEWANLDAEDEDGLIPVPPDGTPVILENGITVSFTTVDGPGSFREMDHWRFAARTAGPQIEILRAAPPDGVQRHYARLGILSLGDEDADGALTADYDDCRVFWPPEVQTGESCACTVCVTADSHASGALTIQDAIDRVGDLGGSVCLEAGLYTLREPVRIEGRNAIRLVGQGLGTLLVWRGAGGAIQVVGSNDIRLERFDVLALPGEDGGVPVHGVTAQNASLLGLRRLAVLVVSPNPEDRFDFGIALDGVQVGTRIEECLVIAPHAIGSRSSYGLDEDEDLQFVAFAELRVLDCILFGGRVGVLIERSALNIAAAILARNLVLSMGAGIRVSLAEIPAASLAVDAGTVVANRTAMSLSAGTLRVQDCEISGGDQAGDGLLLAPPLAPEFAGDAQVIGNTVFGVAGAAIRIAGAHDSILVKRNILRDAGEGGIVTDAGASIRHISVDNNVVERIAAGSQSFGFGIALADLETGQIVGNAIRGVGDGGSGQLYAGIAVQGAGSIDISSNLVAEIGAGLQESVATGILVVPPFLDLSVGANRIFGELPGTEEERRWQAIRIGDLLDDAPGRDSLGPAPGGYLSVLPMRAPAEVVYVNVDDRIWRASAEAVAVALPATASQITVTGNHARTGNRLADQIVWLVAPEARSVAFANNQCDLQGVRDVAVLLGAPALTLTANTVFHRSDALTVLVLTGRGGAVTPVGNITSTAIDIRPSGMPAAFQPLNLTS